MITLKARYGGAIEAAIGKAKAMRDHATVAASDGAEVYAYPHPALPGAPTIKQA